MSFVKKKGSSRGSQMQRQDTEQASDPSSWAGFETVYGIRKKHYLSMHQGEMGEGDLCDELHRMLIQEVTALAWYEGWDFLSLDVNNIT